MSLKKKLVLIGTSVVIVPFFIAGIIIYFLISDSLLDIAKDKSLSSAKELSLLIDTTLNQEVRLIRAISSNPVILQACKSGNYESARKHLQAIHNNIGKEYFSIFILDRQGIARADALYNQQEGLDLSDRSYFLQAKLGKTAITGPVRARGNATPQAPIMIVSAPVEENGKFLGLVATVFNTDFLVKILSRSEEGATSYAYILNQKGLVLAHPKKEYILKLNILEQPGTENIRKIIDKNEQTSASYQFKGVEKIIGISFAKTVDWRVIFSQDRDEVMAPLNRILFAVFFSALILLLLVVPIIALVWGKVSNPIQRMMDLMQTITQYSNECILQIGLDRKIKFANPTFLNTTRQKPEDIIQIEPNLLNENQISPQKIWEDLEAGNPWSGQVIYKESGTEFVILDTMILPLKDASGAVQGYLEIGKDITEELKYKKRMQQTHKLEAIGTLAGGIAHDFNNILSAIYGYAQLSLSSKRSKTEIENYIGQIIKAADRASALIRQILVFSRQKEVDMNPMLPKPVIKEALKLLRASIPVSIKIDSNIKTDSIILAEPTQIHQIVMNLVTNAAHAIGKDLGSIKIELEDYYVDEEFRKTHPELNSGKHIILRISDTGCGMKQEVLDRIFEPFFTTKSQEKGTGLGLSVVHGIVKKMNGIITVYSEPDKGSVFNLIIPCSPVDISGQSQQQTVIQKGTEKIMIIDDESAIASSTQMILTDLGYKVTAFTDAVLALETIQNSPDQFELLITDYTMPNMTGPEIVRALKNAGITIPVILTSGYYTHEMEEEIRELEVSELLRKPIDTHRLSDAIRKSLRSSNPL